MLLPHEPLALLAHRLPLLSHRLFELLPHRPPLLPHGLFALLLHWPLSRGPLCYNSRAVRQRGSTVEQLICNQWVAGSIPVAGSTIALAAGSLSSSRPFNPKAAVFVFCA